jgi:hypothetical protein
MRTNTSFLLLVFSLACVAVNAQSRGQRVGPYTHHPGPLETFLREAKSPGLETKIFGSFEGEDKAKATFKAIIAWDRARPETKLRGLAIELVKGDCRHTAYVDVDISNPEEDLLKFSLTQLEGIEDRDAARIDWRTDKSLGWGTSAGIMNALPPSERAWGQAETVLNIGWWTARDRDPVLDISSLPCRDLLFPTATITDVIKSISAARDYLWSH